MLQGVPMLPPLTKLFGVPATITAPPPYTPMPGPPSPPLGPYRTPFPPLPPVTFVSATCARPPALHSIPTPPLPPLPNEVAAPPSPPRTTHEENSTREASITTALEPACRELLSRTPPQRSWCGGSARRWSSRLGPNRSPSSVP